MAVSGGNHETQRKGRHVTTAANATKKGVGALTGAFKTTTKPNDAPSAATGKCKDGTYTEAKDHSGACSKHGGVDAWYE